MSEWINLQLILAIVIVVLAIAVFALTAWHKIAAIGFLRDDYDRRAPWLALGIIIGAVILYYMKS